LVTTLQAAVTRESKALDSVVLSVTQFSSGTAYNIIPDEAVIRGCTRYQSPGTGSVLRNAMERMTAGVCAAHRARYVFRYLPGYPPVVNTEKETTVAVRAAVRAAGKDQVDGNCPPLMASEDFSYFLEKVPGCYVFLGNGTHTDSHSSHFDFNDEVLSVGVAYWVSLVEQELKGSD